MKKLIRTMLGVLLVLSGIVLTILPGSILFVLAGLVLLSMDYALAKRGLYWTQKRARVGASKLDRYLINRKYR